MGADDHRQAPFGGVRRHLQGPLQPAQLGDAQIQQPGARFIQVAELFAPGQALIQDDTRPTCRAHLPETLQIAGLQWLFNGENLALQSAEVGDAPINGAPKVVRVQAHPGRVGAAVEEGRHLARVPAGVAGHLDLEIIETQPAVTG